MTTIVKTSTERRASGPGAALETCRDLWEAKEIWGAMESERPAWDLNSTWISFRTWVTHFGGRKASVMKMTTGGRAVGLFAAHFTRRRMGPVNFRVLESIGNEHWRTAYPVAGNDPEAAMRALISGLSRRRDWDVLEIGPMAAECPQVGLLLEAGKETGLASMTCHREDDWRVRISGTWEDYYKGRSANLRHPVSRSERRLAALGDITFEVFTGGPEFSERFAEFCEVEGSGWKGSAGTAIRCDSSVMRFHEDLMRAAAERGQLRLFFLRMNGRTVACNEVVIHDGVAYDLKIGRDESLDAYRPGHIAFKRTLEHFFRTGEVHTLDFMIGGGAHAGHKTRWATEKREYVTLRLFNPRTARGLLARHWFSIEARWRTRRAARQETPRPSMRSLQGSHAVLDPAERPIGQPKFTNILRPQTSGEDSMDTTLQIRSRAEDREVTSLDPGQARLTRLIRTSLALAEVRNAWDSAAGEKCLPMTQYAWVKHAADCFCRDGELLVVSAGRPGRAAFAPLARKAGLTGRLEALGASQLFEPFDVAYSDPSGVALLGEALAKLKSPIVLKRVAAGSGVIASIESAVRGRGVVLTRPAAAHPWIPLDESWTAPERHLNSGRRSDLRRAMRIAESMGSVKFEVLVPAPAELGPLMEEAFAVGGYGWKARSGTALACDSQVTDFFRRYAQATSEAGTLRLAFFRIDGRAVAMQMAAAINGGYWLLKMEYDERSARCSPGNLLTAETIRYAARAGLRSYEFLGTVEPCTELWTNHVHETVSLFLYPYSVKGVAAWIADSTVSACARVASRLPNVGEMRKRSKSIVNGMAKQPPQAPAV